ncbi:ETC complex I subunit [Methylobacterium sp. A54F]
MSSARIYQPAKDASQSGLARTKQWLLEFDRTSPRETDPLMGWTGSSDMLQQVRLEFDTREEAIAYAQRAGIAYRVEEPQKPVIRKGLSYSDNFKFNRTAPWTH